MWPSSGKTHNANPLRPSHDGLDADATLVTVIGGYPAALSWLDAVAGHRMWPLGVDRFRQSGDIPNLYRAYGLDAEAILDAAAAACLDDG